MRSRNSSTVREETKVARLTRERDELLEQQTATSEVLGLISRSKFELQPILRSVVDTAARLCRAEVASVFRLESGLYRFAVGYSLDPAYQEIEQQTPISPGQGTLVGRAALTRKVVQIDDAWNDPLYVKKADAKIGAVRSMIGVPLMREGEPIGVIALARTRVEPFVEREIELVRTFAGQAVIAIENTRLLNELRQRTTDLTESLEQQTATSEVLQTISSSPGDLEPVFQAMLEKAVRICDATFGNLHLCEDGQFGLDPIDCRCANCGPRSSQIPGALAQRRYRGPAPLDHPGQRRSRESRCAALAHLAAPAPRAATSPSRRRAA